MQLPGYASTDTLYRSRDNHQQRAYAAEETAFTSRERKVVVPKFLDRLVATPEWEEWLPNVPTVRWHALGRSHSPRGGRIYGRPAIRTRYRAPLWLVCHELAHVIIQEQDLVSRVSPRRAWHGPQWAAVYLTLVLWQLGESTASQLANAFDTHGVPYQ